MSRLLLVVFVLLAACASVSAANYGKVFYKTFVNGTLVPESPDMILEYADSAVKIYSDVNREKLIPQALKETTYMDLRKKMIYKTMINKDGEIFSVQTPFSDLAKLTLKDDKMDITVGKVKYTCRKAEVVLFSNKIEMWYTDQASITGTPSPRSGMPAGLVLKYVRNGNYELLAYKIQNEKTKKPVAVLPETFGGIVNDADYYAKSVDNYVTTVNIFNNDQICWGWEMPNPTGEVENEVYHFVNGTVIAKKIKLPAVGHDYTIYAELTQYSNGDAYDRTGSVFVIPVDKKQSFLDGLKNGKNVLPVYKTKDDLYQGVVRTDSFDPIVEVMRFFTPFGVRYFNDKRAVSGQRWEDAAYFKQDVTDLLPILQNEVWIGTYIGNYDKGGHKVKLDLKYYPGEMMVHDIKDNFSKPFVVPLFNTVNVMEMGGQNYGTMFKNDSLTVSFTIPEGLKKLRLRYTSTGHGGWENGDEYVQKLNSIIVDDKLVFSYVPWRTDCGTYRKYNPASGNFWNGITSSDGSRSGWCPGTTTNPVYVDLSHLKPGTHVMKIAIPLGPREGGSFSAWCVSGVLIGE